MAPIQGTPTFIIVASAAGAQQLQGWLNSISGSSVITEAVTITDSTGTEKLTSVNPGTVDAAPMMRQIIDLLEKINAQLLAHTLIMTNAFGNGATITAEDVYEQIQ
jgi:hypothetical protein